MGVAVLALAAFALVPGYLLIAPSSSWEDVWLLIALGLLAVIANFSTVPLAAGPGFDGAIALMLIAVAFAGPLPALEVVVLPWLVNAAIGRRAPLRTGALANLASYGWQAILAAVVLAAGGVHDPTAPSAMPWLIAAGFALYVVGWMGSAIHAPLCLGHPFRGMVRAFVDMLPAASVMLVLAALTIVLTGPLHLLALALFTIIAILPQTFLAYAARSRPVARLDRTVATQRYAYAIAVQLDLTRAERSHIADVVTAAERHPATGDAIDYVCALLDDPAHPNYHAQLATEWWNGSGAPLHLQGEEIPLAARVVTVAQTWANLTARGTPQLSHHEALQHLNDVAGPRLDPTVVDAAHAVIDQEAVTAREPAPEPRLHRLRLPGRLRHALASAARPDPLVGG